MRSSTALVILSILASASAAPIESQQQDKRWCIWGWGTTCTQVTPVAVASSAKATSTAAAVIASVVVKPSAVVQSSAISSASAVKSSSAAVASASAAVAVQIKWDACKSFDWSPWSTGWSWSGYNIAYVKAWYLDNYGTNPPPGYTWNQVSALVSSYGHKTVATLPKSTYKAGGGCVNPWSKPTASVAASSAKVTTTAAAASSAKASAAASSAAASSVKASAAAPSAAAPSAAAPSAAAPSAAAPSAAAPSAAAPSAAAPSAAAPSAAAPSAAAPSAAAPSAAAPSAAAPSDAAPSAAAPSAAAPSAAAPSSGAASGDNSGSTGSTSGSTGSTSGSTGSTSGSTGTVSGDNSGSNTGSTGSNTGSNTGSTGTSTGTPGTGSGSNTGAAAPVTLSTGYSSAGCFQEVEGRLLAGVQTSSGSQTLEQCTALCAANGFQVAGLEYGSECYCGNVADLDDALESGECKMACSGDATQICGGPNAINAFINTSVQAKTAVLPAGWTSYGNVAEGTNGRALTYLAYSDNSNSNVKCATTCQSLGYSISGTEYSSECYCGNGFSNGGGAFSTNEKMPCSADSAQTCGGPNMLSISTSLSAIPSI